MAQVFERALRKHGGVLVGIRTGTQFLPAAIQGILDRPVIYFHAVKVL
jgi:hypothetical protein